MSALRAVFLFLFVSTTLCAATPIPTAISPNSGPVTGGTIVTITGTDFDATTTVAIGGNAATNVALLSSTSLRAEVPAGAAFGAVDVSTTNADGTGTLAGGYTYVPPRPSDAPADTIPGLQVKYFQANGSTVPADFSALTPFTTDVRTDNTLFDLAQRSRNENIAFLYTGFVTIPSTGTYTFFTDSDDGARLYIGSSLVVDANMGQGQGTEEFGLIALEAGVHAIRIEFAQGTGGFGLIVRFQGPTIAKREMVGTDFTALPAPTVTGISPVQGPTGGNTQVTITGTGFVPGASVAFNGKSATQVVVVNSSTITCNTPGDAVGNSSVVVVNPNGGSRSLADATPSLLDGYTYVAGGRSPDLATAAGLTSGTMFYKFYSNGSLDGQIPGNNTPNVLEGLTPAATGSLAGPFLTGNFLGQAITAGPTATPPVGGDGGNMLSPATPQNSNFYLRHNFYVNIPYDGVYTFATSSDDGSLLFVGENLIVNSNFSQGVVDRQGTISLLTGLHRITVLYGQGGGGFALSVRYQKPANLPFDPGDASLIFIPDAEIFIDAKPTVTASDPAFAPAAGGKSVTITGTNFVAGATVTIDGNNALNVAVLSNTTLTCVVPAGTVTGTPVPVTVINPTGPQGSANVLTYTGQATHFTVAAPANATAGAAFNVTVTALDAGDRPDTGYVGTIYFTSSDPAATLPADFTFDVSSNGNATFSTTLNTSGVRTLTATDTVTPSITGSASITVNPGAAILFDVTAANVTPSAGTPTNVTVVARDAQNNIATGYVGTFNFTSSDAQATLPSNGQTLTNGQGTFSVTFGTNGSQTITATDSVTPSITGFDTVTVSAGTVASLSVTGLTSPSVAGSTGNTFTVTALDQFGNVVPTYNQTIAISSSDTLAILPESYSFTPSDNGSHTFIYALATAGTQTITVTNAPNVPTLTTTESVVVTPDDALTLSVSNFPDPYGVNTLGTFLVTALDRFGNTATGYTGTVNFTSSNGNVTFTSLTYTFNTADAGEHTFDATFNSTGVVDLTATDSVTPSITGTQSAISIQSFAPQTIVFGPLENKTFGDPSFSVSATASSTLPVTFSATGPASISSNGNVVTLTGAGIVTIIASQNGGGTFSPAPDVSQSFEVAKSAQTITFNAISDKSNTATPFDVTTLASSGLPVTLSILAGPATISGNTVTVTGIGAVTVRATQLGDANYNAAVAVDRTFNVTNPSPVISSSITFSPSPVVAGVSTTFQVAANDPNGEALTYTWNFGDSTGSTLETPTHTYSAAGTYTVTVVVKDTVGNVVSSSLTLTVQIGSGAVAPEVDTDGDGFSDEIEVEAGTSPTNAADTPFSGAPAGTPLLLTDVKLGIKLNFAKSNSDSINLRGTLLIAKGTNLFGQKVIFNVGGVTQTFTLDSKGGAKTAAGSLKILSKGTANRTGKFTLKLSRGAFATKFVDEGLTNAAARFKDVNITVTVLFNSKLFQTVQAQSYTGKAGRGGSTKDKK